MILRPMRLSDAEPLCELAADPEVWQRTQGPPLAAGPDAWRSIIEAVADRPWAFTAEHEGEVVGAFSMLRNDGQYAHRAEIGGWLGKAYWGNGWGTQAFRDLIAFGASNGLQVIEGKAAADHPAIAHAGERAGMRLEYVIRDGVIRSGKLLDEYVYIWRAPSCRG